MAFTSTMSPFFSRLFRPFSNTSSMSLQPSESLAARAASYPPNAERATVAAGCFWGVEHLFRKHFDGKGLIDARVGYTGGDDSSAPSYRSVCSGRTGHAESLLVVFDPEQVTYRQLIEFFFRMHDPTTKDRQGMDSGTQYRSAIFTNDDKQNEIAKDIAEKVGNQWYKKPVTTQIAKAGKWYDAEDYHQLYLENNPGGYECPAHFMRNFPALSE